MERIVTIVVCGHEIPVKITGATSDEQARSLAIDEAAQSFHVRAITAVKPRKRMSLWDTYKDGFRNFFSFTEESTLLAERELDAALEDAFPTKTLPA